MVVPAALLIVAATIADLEGRAGWLRASWAIYLGELSFCFYLVHYPVMWGFSRGTWGTENWTGLAGLLPVGVCFVVSAANGGGAPPLRRKPCASAIACSAWAVSRAPAVSVTDLIPG